MHDARHDPSQPSDARPMSPPNASIEGITLRSEPATLGIFYHIAPPEELHPLTDIESLRAELATLRSLLDAALPRLDWLEARERTHAAAIEHTADVVQAELLRSGGGVA